MADNAPKSNTLLYLVLAGAGAYLLLKPKQSEASTTPSTTAATAGGWADSGAGSAAPTAPVTPNPVTSTVTKPGYALDGEDDIRFGSQAKLAGANNSGGFLTTEYGEGSRNVRLNLARALGSQYHILVEEIVTAIVYRYSQGGFNSWDDMYWSFVNDPGSFAAVLTAYNNENSYQPIKPRW